MQGGSLSASLMLYIKRTPSRLFLSDASFTAILLCGDIRSTRNCKSSLNAMSWRENAGRHDVGTCMFIMAIVVQVVLGNTRLEERSKLKFCEDVVLRCQ